MKRTNYAETFPFFDESLTKGNSRRRQNHEVLLFHNVLVIALNKYKI